jgi:hypothetical protein
MPIGSLYNQEIAVFSFRCLGSQRLDTVDVTGIERRKFGSDQLELAGTKHMTRIEYPDLSIIKSDLFADPNGPIVLDYTF